MTTDNIDSIMSPTIHDFRPSDGYTAPAIDKDAERARFEEWADSWGYLCIRHGHGYEGRDMQSMWFAWLARAKQGAK